MKVLVTGARGQVGRAVINAVPATTQLIAVTHSELDIGDARAVDGFVASTRPDAIVNAAAYTAVDRAETEADLAQLVNATGPANLARAAAASGARLIHLSTDFVFDGMTSAPYRPQDPTNPLSVYGATKLAGELAVREILDDRSVVLRTAWVYDATGRNFLNTMLRLMRERGTVRVVADQFGSPTAAHSIAEAIWAIVARPEVAGTHHWTDSGVASWYDFAVAIAEEAASAGKGSASAGVIPIGTADYPTPAKRPRFSVLDKAATCAALSLTPRHWRQNLRQVIGEVSIA
jgi:dTDP-4-dehydrorhamnose reductase